ncbi:16S rRNA (guanine527-N7)-methyltransferase [Entomoplasma freundtii]|uniref:Ribosomal RNA small subunit methyltransferase G n=1 Tax=Entomoplasma freundtii TaxID=74700 RepID=A0A2K8NTZ0_9MOLU|nr:16S rRNA (guanine(527)-N(7))-methyltransferase RsmG [Entomoplasma freundtii]ATZ16093.1 16S rRNA (guanine527-N7)-methyltransferase [Entomoplasma freundtii]TDY57006.1 16S rRNA (guanine527-N7)-methyltransferase [Entomoplasma freundtii]
MYQNWELFTTQKNLPLTPTVKEQLQKYFDFLVQENKKSNLTRIVSEDDVYQKHFLDSILFTEEVTLKDQNLLDVGSGAGFPGLVLKIFYPDLNITLVESNTKKAAFLEAAITHLDLKKIQVVNERMELYSRQHHEEFDIIVSRAVASLKVLLEICAQALKVDGYFIALKGPKAFEEEKNAAPLIKELNFKLVKTQVLKELEFGERINLFYKKMAPTPEQYPRDYRIIKKQNR